jgi:hypothetical protein
MSSFPLHSDNSLLLNVSTGQNAAVFSEKRARILRQIAGSGQLVDVRPASRLEVRPKPEMLSVGIAEVDALTGGIPRGCLSEFCGSASSGKASVMLAALAAATQRGESCVLIDASDGFDPESGAAAGVEFGKLLWVRCGIKSPAVSYQSSALNFEANDKRSVTNGCLSNNEHSFARDARRMTHDAPPLKTHSERRLEQVLKTTDLVLQSGGFGLVVLDIAGIPEKYVRRIPLASWFRFQRAVEHTKTALLVLSEFACAQTCAAMALKLSAISRQSFGNNLEAPVPTHAQLLKEFQIEAEIVRSRLERKPAGSVKASFATQTIRAG